MLEFWGEMRSLSLTTVSFLCTLAAWSWDLEGLTGVKKFQILKDLDREITYDSGFLLFSKKC